MRTRSTPNHLLLLAVLWACGCRSGRFQLEPSEYALSPEMREYADSFEARDDAMDVYPVPYVSHGDATNRFASERFWLVLFLGLEQFGRLERGYAYQDIETVLPVWVGLETHLFREDGTKRAGHGADVVGLLWPLPWMFLVSLQVEETDDRERDETHTDLGFSLLHLPSADRALLRISTAGIHLFFFPVWEKDRKPREADSVSPPPAGETDAAG